MLGPMAIQFRLKEILAQRQRLTGQKMTYRALAEKSGLDLKQISQIANNQIVHVGLSTIDRLCEALDIEPGDLLVRVK